MRRRKHNRRKIGNMSIIYISSIIALSFMGVGYAAWSDGLNIDMIVKTGNTFPVHELNRISKINLDDGEWISLKLSDDKKTLYIDGEVYPTYNGAIPVKIVDEGSIPVTLKDIDSDNATDITELKEEAKAKYSRSSFTVEDVVESFDLNINPDNDKEDSKDKGRMKMYSLEEQDEITNLQNQINEYKKVKDYDFEYELLFEQAL